MRRPPALAKESTLPFHTVSPPQLHWRRSFWRSRFWVRTSDGVIFPAPRHPGFGIGWGNSGRGATALALLIHQLLHDITTAPQPPAGAPSGLLALTARLADRNGADAREQLQQALDTPREDI
jgi:hypothetical protein